jgi:hypothetical protein
MREMFSFFFVIMKFRDPAHSELTESSLFKIYLWGPGIMSYQRFPSSYWSILYNLEKINMLPTL